MEPDKIGNRLIIEPIVNSLSDLGAVLRNGLCVLDVPLDRVEFPLESTVIIGTGLYMRNKRGDRVDIATPEAFSVS